MPIDARTGSAAIMRGAIIDARDRMAESVQRTRDASGAAAEIKHRRAGADDRMDELGLALRREPPVEGDRAAVGCDVGAVHDHIILPLRYAGPAGREWRSRVGRSHTLCYRGATPRRAAPRVVDLPSRTDRAF